LAEADVFKALNGSVRSNATTGMVHPKITSPPKNSGRTDGWSPADKAEHSIKCPIYGHMINMRDLAEVLEHAGLHQAPAEI
jgi:hypothetical protein